LVTVQRRGLWAHYTVVRPALDERRRRVRQCLDSLTTGVLAAIKTKQIKAKKIGEGYRISREALQDYLKS
jgi:excisionase family DNA binding protein